MLALLVIAVLAFIVLAPLVSIVTICALQTLGVPIELTVWTVLSVMWLIAVLGGTGFRYTSSG